MRLLISITLMLTASACTWVKMAPGGDAIRVVTLSQSLTTCEKRGEVEVSVKDRLGPLARNELKVRDELETLARNEAAGLGADTIQSRTEPSEGVQRFAAFRCGTAALPAQARAAERLPAGDAETYPIGD